MTKKGLLEEIQAASKSNATKLFLRDSQLSELPPQIGQLTNLNELDLSGNQISKLPPEIGQLKNLTWLYLHNNQISALPPKIGQLTNLSELDLRGNQLLELPREIGQLTNLNELYLRGNQLLELPREIGQLTNLNELDLSGNQLSELPPEVGQLINLTVLYLNDNQLSELLPEIGLLTNLNKLDLSGNQLSELLPEIGQLTNLTGLYLRDNQLSELPPEIGPFSNLNKLDLSGNQLSELPPEIGQLNNLTRLYLRGNQLSELTSEVGQLVNLRELDLRGNQLSGLPKPIIDLKKLRTLLLHDNSGLNLPINILGAIGESNEPSKILHYYFRVKEAERPLNEAKLILVGHGEVGKTSLVNRLVDDNFNPGQRKTEGINITNWPIILKNNEEVQLNIWDFGGQEIMHSTHQFFLTHRSLYILVLNGRQGHEDVDADYWLSIIKNFSNSSPTLVVLNKMKSHPADLNRGGLLEKYPFVRDFVETDCEDGTGIDSLRKAIRKETDNLKHLRDPFPSSWFEIKNRISQMGDGDQSFITFDDFRKICADLGEKNKEAQEDLAFYLHNLGIALNYKEDPRLRDKHVLNPHWVTNGIYTIINTKSLKSQNGVLKKAQLSSILNTKKYPSNMYGFLLELMRKFELCFPFPKKENQYLVPELLDKDQPKETKSFDQEKCLNLQYHYSIPPEGVIPKFIVRTHPLSIKHPRWRTGVILEFEGNMALVKADVNDKRVHVSVSGAVTNRQRILAVIRSDFESIHKSSKLEPIEMVPVPEKPNVLIEYQELLIMEKSGIKTFPKVIDGNVHNLDVQTLLNGVDLDGERRPKKEKSVEDNRLRLFYSYSHKDETLRNALETHLKLLERQNLIQTWHDRKIMPGDEWGSEIDNNLEMADIILLLVSSDFIASDYCYDIEMKRSIEKHDKKETIVIPVILRDVDWHSAPFGKLQALPKDGKPVRKWRDRDSAWRNVSEGIKKVVNEIQSKRSKRIPDR